jgi:hypothetical protein
MSEPSPSAVPPSDVEERPDETADVGPDPVWPLGLFIVGLLIMASGGAFTWHWVFMIGEALLLIGVVWFLAAVAITRLKQEPVAWRERIPAFFRGSAEVSVAEEEQVAEAPRRRRRKKKAKRRKKRPPSELL